MAIVIWVGRANQKQKHGGRSYRYKMWKALLYENGRFGSKYIGGFDLIRYKFKVQKIRTYVCDVCGVRFKSNINRCPICG